MAWLFPHLVMLRLEDNYVPDKSVPARKMVGDMNPKTIAPWSHGSLPADPVTTKIQPPKPTSLWIVPPEQKKKFPFERSNDPILGDNICSV